MMTAPLKKPSEALVTEVRVLDHGYVRLVTWTPPDMVAITSLFQRSDVTAQDVINARDLVDNNDLVEVNAARASYGTKKHTLDEKDKGLVKFLADAEPVPHSSPFRHAHVTLEINAPLPIARQWWRHAIGGGTTEDGTPWSELSRRYVRGGIQYHQPAVWRSKPANSKQGSGAPISEELQKVASDAFQLGCDRQVALYEMLLNMDIAPEQARFVLPQGVYTSWQWSPSVQTLVGLLQHRLAPDAQWEIREFAKAVDRIVRPLYPLAFESFVPRTEAV